MAVDVQGPTYLAVERRGLCHDSFAAHLSAVNQEPFALHSVKDDAGTGPETGPLAWEGTVAADPGPGTASKLSLALVGASYALDPAQADPPGGTSPATNLSGVSVAQTASHQHTTGSHFSLPGIGPEHDDARNFLAVRSFGSQSDEGFPNALSKTYLRDAPLPAKT